MVTDKLATLRRTFFKVVKKLLSAAVEANYLARSQRDRRLPCILSTRQAVARLWSSPSLDQWSHAHCMFNTIQETVSFTLGARYLDIWARTLAEISAHEKTACEGIPILYSTTNLVKRAMEPCQWGTYINVFVMHMQPLVSRTAQSCLHWLPSRVSTLGCIHLPHNIIM